MIIAICITLLIVAFLLHISGGDKEGKGNNRENSNYD